MRRSNGTDLVNVGPRCSRFSHPQVGGRPHQRLPKLPRLVLTGFGLPSLSATSSPNDPRTAPHREHLTSCVSSIELAVSSFSVSQYSHLTVTRTGFRLLSIASPSSLDRRTRTFSGIQRLSCIGPRYPAPMLRPCYDASRWIATSNRNWDGKIRSRDAGTRIRVVPRKLGITKRH
jgi:hypothetical protein